MATIIGSKERDKNLLLLVGACQWPDHMLQVQPLRALRKRLTWKSSLDLLPVLTIFFCLEAEDTNTK